MNPYNFVRLRAMDKDARQTPVSHSKFVAGRYTGRITCTLTALSAIFIPAPNSTIEVGLPIDDKKKLKANLEFFHLGNPNRPAIPGSSLKGMLRSVAEAAVNGCLSVLTPEYTTKKDNKKKSRQAVKEVNLFQFAEQMHLQPCNHLERSKQIPDSGLCPTCRLFGMPAIEENISTPGARPEAFAGQVRIGDAHWSKDNSPDYDPTILLTELSTPDATSYLYFTPGRKSLRGRKFYYHHGGGKLLLSVEQQQKRALALYEAYMKKQPIKDIQQALDDGLDRKTLIRPLSAGAQFEFEVEFQNLDIDELSLLIYTLELGCNPAKPQNEIIYRPGVYHKLGYGKPAGLGSVAILIRDIVFYDPLLRYSSGADSGIKPPEEGIRNFVKVRRDQFRASHAADGNLADLEKILEWPNTNLDLGYPPLQAFGENKPGKYQLPSVGRERRRR